MTPEVTFILSANRSGSTWLNLVLGSHSWAANVGEFYRPFLFPGHVVCRLCEAEGLPECRVLHGLTDIPVESAFHFAAERFARSHVVDASKRLDWCARFVGRSDLQARLIHLVRHPAGYAFSERIRRPAASLDELLQEWCAANQEIERFVESVRCPSALFAYDDLADAPVEELTRLCAFLGGRFESSALEYWRFEHHGLGANGAASVYLAGKKVRNWQTSDDAFYADLERQPLRSDRRWMDGLSAAECERMIGHAYARRIRSRIANGRDWTRGGT